MRTLALMPSGMHNVMGAVDPAKLVDKNILLINQRFGLSIQPTTTADSDNAASVVQAAFDAVAAALHVTFWPVADSRDPEAAVQANFEMINAAW